MIKNYPEYMKELKVSDFLKKDKCPLSKNDIAKEYDVLDQLFDQDEVVK
tara:strand:- start:636 stop:782 length:147 start_codon:yes stop_codon:yes gene_type:complete